MTPAICHPNRPHKARGECNVCYMRRRRGSMATCHPERLRSNRSRKLCRPCYRDQVTIPARHARKRRATLGRLYGITPEEYDRLLEDQGGVCAICRKPSTMRIHGHVARLAIDHDHETKQIRGLLCGPCNQLLGSVNDDPDVLTAAIAYLRASRSS